MVAAKKTKYAKSRRKGWRKVNIDDVEQFYEDVRLKERLGQPLDQPAFIIEKEGTHAETEAPVQEKKVVKRKKLKTTKDLSKNIKAFKSLLSSSKVPPLVIGCKHKVEPKSEKIPKRIGKTIKKKKEIWTDVKPFDLWNDSEKGDTTVKKQKKKPSLLPAVELPHPGTSVNPSAEDHQKLLEEAHAVEMKKLKQEEHYKRVLDAYRTKKTPTQIEAEWLKEMSGGLSINGEAEEEEEDDDSVKNTDEGIQEVNGFGPIKKVVRAEDRKSKAKRRREMLAKMKEKTIAKEKQQKRRDAQIFQLRRIKKEIRQAEEESKKRSEEKVKKLDEKMRQPRRIGPHKYEEPEIAVNLSDELSARLRSVKTESDPFEERMKSFQKRNVIEPRKLILKQRKKSIKYFTKRDCRDQD